MARGACPTVLADTSQGELARHAVFQDLTPRTRGKLLALQDLARKAQDGAVDFKAILKMDDDAVIHHLIQVRGIGRWTAEMFRIFNLGRLDAFPVLDLGIQKGVQRLYGYKKLPAESTMRKHAEKWKPYRIITPPGTCGNRWMGS